MQVWIACLASYNAGHLHGRWVEVTDAEDLRDAITAVLKSSKEPDAEEWAIHDYDGFGHNLTSLLGENPDLDNLVALTALDWDMDLIDGVAGYLGTANASEIEQMLDDNYIGTFSTLRDYAVEVADEHLLADVPDEVARYFDYDSYARDLAFDLLEIDVPEGVALFHTS